MATRRLLFLLLLLCCQPALALDPHKSITQYPYDVWQTEQGLPQNTVQAIVQTQDGYLWVGTQLGLARFDGVRFTTFEKSNSPEFLSNDVLSLHEDRQGTLWIGTYGGGLMCLKNGKFTTYTTKQGLSNDVIWDLAEGKDESLWIATNEGLNRLKDGKFTKYTTEDGLPNSTLWSLCVDHEGTLWIGTDGGGLSRFKDGKFTTLTTRDGLKHDVVIFVYEDRQQNLWVGTYGGGLSRYREGRFKTFRKADGLSDDSIFCLLEDRAESLWVGTASGGLDRFRDGQFKSFTTRDGLTNDRVLTLYEDKEGSLWFGTDGGGLNRFRDGKFTTITTLDGLSSNFVQTVSGDHLGAIWIGTNGAGVNRYNGKEVSIYTTRDGLSSDVIMSVWEDHTGAIWIGTDGGGLNRFRDGKFTQYGPNDGLPGSYIWSIFEDRQGTLWLGTDADGLASYKDGKFTTYTTANGLTNNSPRALAQDTSGTIWIGTLGGGIDLYQGGKFTSYTTRDGLSSDIVLCIYPDPRGPVWIATSNGLCRFRDGKFVCYTGKAGLFDDSIYQILEDRKGYFWLGTGKGIFRASRKELEDYAEGRINFVHSTLYGKADGMKSNECRGGSQPSGWMAPDGILWFPTGKGVVRVDPEDIKVNRQPPPVIIEEMLVDEQKVPLIEHGTDVKAGKHTFEFHYTGLSFLAPEKVQFQYQLEGFDKNWVNAGARRAAYYTNLPPGVYRFRVIACNNDGFWNETGATLDLTLKPHFYQTAAFYVFCAISLILLGIGAYGIRLSHLKGRERELISLVEERTRDLSLEKEKAERALQATETAHRDLVLINEALRKANDVKTELLSLAAHDLKNPLQLISGYTEAMMEKVESDAKLRNMVSAVHRASQRMLGLIDEVLETTAMEGGHVELEKVDVDAGVLAQLVVGSNQLLAVKKNQKLTLTVEGKCVAPADEGRLSEAMDNLVSNAIKYSPHGKSIWVSVKGDENTVRFQVKDEGPGLTEVDKKKLFGRFQRLSARPTGGESSTGLGLAIAKDLVEMHGGTILLESEHGKGSTFTIELPVKDKK